jgi:GTP-binding protein
MKITSAEFLKSAIEEEDWPRDSLPEIAFLGRSNVGKSSLINSLLGVRNLARTSRTPGRTQLLNFFTINRILRFVDFPGYGFARVPREMKRVWDRMATNFLANRAQLVLSIQIVDSRHEPTKQDNELRHWLASINSARPHLTVATKSDKLSQNELRRNLERIERALASEVIAFSATTGRGREQVWRSIEDVLTVAARPSPSDA